MKPVTQLQYSPQVSLVGNTTNYTIQEKISQILSIIEKHIDDEGRIVYPNGDRGSFAMELLLSIFAENKTKKHIDEKTFMNLIKELVSPELLP